MMNIDRPTAVRCDMISLVSISSEFITADTTITYGELALLTCETGYTYTSGSTSFQCNHDKSWEGQPLVCTS